MFVPWTLVAKSVLGAGISDNFKQDCSHHHGYTSDDCISTKNAVVTREFVVETEVASCRTLSEQPWHVAPYIDFVRAHVLGNFDLAQCVCDELLADSNGGYSIVDSEFADKLRN